jgi:hypothetical protein
MILATVELKRASIETIRVAFKMEGSRGGCGGTIREVAIAQRMPKAR